MALESHVSIGVLDGNACDGIGAQESQRLDNVREERRGDGVAEQSKEADKGGNGRAQTAAASQEAAEEGEGAKEEGEQEKDPAEAGEQVKLVVGARVGAGNARGDVGGVAVPGMAKGQGGLGLAAIGVTLAADVEVGPLGDAVVGAVNARRVGLEEVGLAEGGDGGYAGEDDEEEEEQRGAHEDEADEAEGGVWEDSVSGGSLCFFCGQAS